MKRILSCLLLCVLLLSLFSIPVSAASATVSLTASAATVYSGNRVSVYIKIQGSEKIGSWNFSLSYDPAYLEYVSGADGGGGGTLLFVDSTDGVSSISKTVVFKTKRLGETKVTVNPTQIIGFDSMRPMSVSSATRAINIIPTPTLSGDNTLSSLSVSPGTLEPVFAAGTQNYTMTVPFDVTELTVSGTPAHRAASVAVTGNALNVGENKVEVTCTAQNGSTRVYTITVTRQQSELAGVTAAVGDKTYTVAHDPSQLSVPEGFTASSLSFGDKKILAYLSPKDSIAIAYLISEAESGWFVYDRAQQSFYPLVAISATAQSYVILPLPAEISLPAGFIPAEITVGETAYSVYKNTAIEAKGLCLVYAMAPDGTLGFYYYDESTRAFISYFASSVMTGANGEILSEGEMQTLLSESNSKNRMLEIVALSLALVVVLLVIGLILAIVLPKRKKKAKIEKEEDRVDEAMNTLVMGEPVTYADNHATEQEIASSRPEDPEGVDELRQIYGLSEVTLERFKFCAECGEKLPYSAEKCPKCGKECE